MTTIKRRIRLFIMGMCPYCEKYHYDSYINEDRIIQYHCHNCGSLNEIVEDIINAMVD